MAKSVKILLSALTWFLWRTVPSSKMQSQHALPIPVLHRAVRKIRSHVLHSSAQKSAKFGFDTNI